MGFKMRTLSLPEPRSQEDLLMIFGGPLKMFSFHELVVATDNFNNKNILGRGGFGKVFKGRLQDGSLVAVKRLKEECTHGGQLQFQTEVKFEECQVSDHRNVISLRGYCVTKTERLLVYPYMENICAASRLRERSESDLPLDWATRKRIALGAAKGLAHLHSFRVVHRDVKAANILLDHQFEAHLGDFGLTKFVGGSSSEGLSSSGWMPMEEEIENPFKEEESDEENKNCFTMSCWDFTKTLIIKLDDEAKVGTKMSCWQVTKNEVISISGGDGSGGPIGPPNIRERRDRSEAQAQPNYDFTQVTTAVRGTIGHIAPEYLSSGKCSMKTDVFAYGITLLELITGQRPIDLAHLAKNDDVMLLDWVKGLLQDNKLDVVVDSDMKADYIKEEVEQLVQLALLCTQGCPMNRPVMPEVVKMIANIGESTPNDQLIRRVKDLLSAPTFYPQSPTAQSVTESEWMILGRN